MVSPTFLAAAGVRAAVAARVATARPHHAAAAAGALDGVLPRVEERGLAGRGGVRRRGGRGRGVAVLRREPRLDLRRQDPDLFLLLDREELLAHPAEDVVDDRLRDAD